MNTYIPWIALQVVLLLINSALLLFNYREYRKYRMFKRRYIALMAFVVLNLIWCIGTLVYDTGKASGQW